MYIRFSLNVNVPFFKDLWGYKVSTPAPNTHVGTITTDSYFSELHKSQDLYSEDEKILRDLLNGKPTPVRINATLEGCLTQELFNIPGTLDLDIGGNNVEVNTRLLESDMCRIPWRSRYENTACELQITNEIVEQGPPNGTPVVITLHSLRRFDIPHRNPLGGLKHLLNNPEKYYLSKCGFFIEKPQSLEDYARIYKYESIESAPTPEEILLDPALYTNHENTETSKFARRIISGEFTA